MDHKIRGYNQNMLLGCGFLALLAVIGVTAAVVFGLNREFHLGAYPGAQPVPNQNYANLNAARLYLRVENAYRTQDDLLDVYVWYEHRFGFRDYKRVYEAEGDCLLLEKSTEALVLQRNINIIICETPAGRLILMTRIVSPS